MYRACPTSVICGPGFLGGDTDTPVANLSSEAIDGVSFSSRKKVPWTPWGPFGDGQGPDPKAPPPSWWGYGCNELCVSYISQADADLCAARLAWQCYWRPPTDECIAHPDSEACQDPNPTVYFSNEASCSGTCEDGTEYVYTVPAGSFVALDQATADLTAHEYACQQLQLYRICISDLTQDKGCAESYFEGKVTATGGIQPFDWSVDGALPDGLVGIPTDDNTSFTLSGTPTSPGEFTFNVEIRDGTGYITARKNLTINVLGISDSETLPSSRIFWDYSYTFTATGGSGSYAWTVIDGTLPPGLSLSEDGVLSGNLEDPGGYAEVNYSFTVRVNDSGIGQACTKDFTLLVQTPAPDFSTMVWTGLETCTFGDGDAQVSAAGPHYYAIATSNTSGIGQNRCCGRGDCTYTGPATTARVTVTITKADDPTLTGFAILQGGATTMNFLSGVYPGAYPNYRFGGVGSWEFIIPIHSGVDNFFLIWGATGGGGCCSGGSRLMTYANGPHSPARVNDIDIFLEDI